jgi:hypothetical protein
VALDRGSGAVAQTRSFGGPDLSGVPDALSFCTTGDALSVGSKVVVSWSYTGIALAPGPCFPNQTGSHSNGIAGEDIDVPSSSWNADLGGATQCSLPLFPVQPVQHEALSSDSTLIYRPLGSGGSVTGYPVARATNCLSTLSWATPAAVVPVATPLPATTSWR